MLLSTYDVDMIHGEGFLDGVTRFDTVIHTVLYGFIHGWSSHLDGWIRSPDHLPTCTEVNTLHYVSVPLLPSNKKEKQQKNGHLL